MSCGCCGDSRPLSSAPISKNPADFYAYQGKDVWYTCQPDVALEPRSAASGTASALKCPPMTLPGLLKKAAEKSGQQPALKVERPCPSLEGNKAPAALPEDAWMTWTWQQYYEDVRTGFNLDACTSTILWYPIISVDTKLWFVLLNCPEGPIQIQFPLSKDVKRQVLGTQPASDGTQDGRQKLC